MLQFNFGRPQMSKVSNLQMVKSLELSKESSNFVSSRFKRLRGLFFNQTAQKGAHNSDYQGTSIFAPP